MWLDMMLLDVIQLTLHDFNSTLTWHCIASHVQSGMTILMLAAVSGNIALVRLLVEHGADVWVTDNVSTQLYRIKSHRFTSHWISLYYITLCLIASHLIASHHIVSYHITSHCIISHRVAFYILNDVKSHTLTVHITEEESRIWLVPLCLTEDTTTWDQIWIALPHHCDATP